jgi:hypothetical protein
MTVDVLKAAHSVFRDRYAAAAVAFAAGSLVRGEGTAYSDLDLVVVFPTVPAAYRESFRFRGLPVEVFVHDPETLEYFFVEVDVASGIPALPQMVMEGQEIPGPTDLSRRLKARATAIIASGPPLLDLETERRRRYLLTDLLDDLRGWRSPGELMACGARLFEDLADYHLRAEGHWSGKGKAIPAALRRADAQLCTRYCAAFDSLFRRHEIGPVVSLAEQLMQSKGGLFFQGYRSDAPTTWRTTPGIDSEIATTQE